MKSKMFKKILLFSSLFCLLFTMFVVSSSALTPSDYPTIDNYRFRTSLLFAPFIVGDTDADDPVAGLADKLPIGSYRVDLGDGDYEFVKIPAVVQFETVNGAVIFDMAYITTGVHETGFYWTVYNITGFDNAGDPIVGNGRLIISYDDDGSQSLTYTRSATYYDDTNETFGVLLDVDEVTIYTNADYYSYLLAYEGSIYNSVSIDEVVPSVTDSISSNWTSIMGWVVGALASVQSIFFIKGNLTFIGTLAIIGSAIALITIIVAIVRRFFALRG